MSKIKQTSTNYPLGDFLIRLKNTAMAGNKEVSISSSKSILAVAEALKKFGFLESVKKEEKEIVVHLTFKNKKPLLRDVKLVSKPGLRIYMGVDELEKKKGPSIFLITSPKGIISSIEAVKTRSGGEVIAEIL